MEAFQNLFRLISAPLSSISDDQINSLSDRHLQDFCEARELSSHGDRDVLINRILCARNAAAGIKPAASSIAMDVGNSEDVTDAVGAATAATNTNNSEFDEFDDNDDEFASFDMETAIASTSVIREENVHPNMSQNSYSKKTPAKRPLLEQQPIRSDKRLKTPEEEASIPSSEDSPCTTFDFEEISPQFKSQLQSSLHQHFGHNSFREGQLQIIHSVLQNRDACAFWATGAGKSLTYQLPPLHLNQVGVIITPLVSLMMDQVAKLNARGIAATYLGSAQRDGSVEGRVFSGEYRLVYVTPEKLVGGTFLERLSRMHDGGGRGRVCIFAVDESHCVSEWGHDFRPEFLKIGSAIREQKSNLASVPILALTATAVPTVQDDILRNLHMKLENTTIVKKSFDRPNLKIEIKRKPKNGALAALAVVVKELFNAEGRDTAKSTIVYCATRKEVDDVTREMVASLAHMLSDNRNMPFDRAHTIASQRIKPYHAGLSTREEAHLSFLVGKTPVIVATVAFGMGIDKPDIRRVVHWGPPKTVEEYYQQMGRASRDGLPGEAIMYCDLPDFAKYKNEFYLKSLKGDARKATIESMDALREFCMSDDCCRRGSLMRFFDEEPSFGKWCGTCDICLFREVNGEELERDFAFDGARVLLAAVVLCNGQAWSTIESVVAGKAVDSYRYSPRSDDEIMQLRKFIANELTRMKKKRSSTYLKELIDPLVSKGLLAREIKQLNNKYKSSFVIYKTVSSKTASAFSKDKPIILAVPKCIRELELVEAKKRKRALEELEKKGVDLQHIPEEEKEAGEGEAIAAYMHWFSYIGRLENSGRTEFINQMNDLKVRVIAWRLDTAEQNRIAPTTVMAEHQVYQVAYATATLPSGQVMQKESLSAAGVGSNGIDELTKVLAEWTESVKETKTGVGGGNDDTQSRDVPMYVKPGEILAPTKPWKYAVYRPNKKTGMAAWEASYVRFKKGEHPQTIAMSQQGGKAIQVATVIGHLLEALPQGRAVDLHRLASQTQPPSKEEWDTLRRCELETGMDITKDPATSGKNSEKFAMRDFLLPIMGEDFIAKDYKERTPEESEKFSMWCGKLNWYAALRKVGYEPSFGSPTA